MFVEENHKKKNMDPSYIVCEEYIGQSLALLFCNQNVFDYFMAFLIFRILDVLNEFEVKTKFIKYISF